MTYWVVGGVLLLAVVAGAWYAPRLGRRIVLRNRPRIDRFKLAQRKTVRARLVADPAIQEAVRLHAAATDMSDAAVWRIVHGYVTEIVPFFNVVAYYAFGYRAAGWVLNLLYRVSVEHQDPAMRKKLPKDAILVYLINHRSNADYVLVSYALAGQVAISYAVGEWARAFPLEHLFKAFGSYFVRRKYREPLYHTVLERYVQLITREGVTQGIFLEGGLTRDGRLKAPKIGLLDYVLGIGRDESCRSRLFIVPVAVNYDRVLEDRSLLRELAAQHAAARPPRRQQFAEVVRYVMWNSARLLTRQWKRYGGAAVTVGEPIPLAPWFEEEAQLFNLPKPERLARVSQLSDRIMSRIGTLVPVTPVPLACAAIQSFDTDFITRRDLLQRMEDMRRALRELNGRVLAAESDIAQIFERAWQLLRMRRVLAEDGSGYVVLPGSRELVSYYANSVAHLLGPFEAAVRRRDALPALALVPDALV